jgi:hypothetical protein
MKWIGWAICVIGINMLLTGFMAGMNWIAIIAGLLVAVFALMGALKG